MSTLKEIEEAIAALPREELFRLREFVQDRFDDAWDRQMEEDAQAGRLDHLADAALAEYRTGITRAFPSDE